jgi:hypothetical protein
LRRATVESENSEIARFAAVCSFNSYIPEKCDGYRDINETKAFLKAVKLAGGRKSKAADQVLTMRGSVGSFEDPFQSLRKANHGGSRIAGCVKYDL